MNMENASFLNYSRGATLQAICSRILDAMNHTEELDRCKREIDIELAVLMQKRPIIWDRPDADVCYFERLKELKALLEQGAGADDVRAFSDEIRKITRGKIHALFLTEEVSCWPSIESLFEAASQSSDYHATLVYTPFEHKNLLKNKDYYQVYRNDYHLPVVRHDQYHLESDSPDVVFMIKPYSSVPARYQPNAILSVIPRVVYVPYGMEITVDLVRFAFQHYLQLKAWRHCAYGSIVKDYAEKYGYCCGENVVVWGHPKADQYLSPHKPSEEMRRFINGRKAILWTPHHLVDLSKPGTGTWLIWGRQILEIALQNTDIAFIFRPHPMMMGALLNNGYLSGEEAKEIEERIAASDNILWDKNDSYVDAIRAADAIITDGTTFSVEFLYTGKPILLTPRNMEGFYAMKDMLESYYVVQDMTDVENFVRMIRCGNDPLEPKRLAMREKMLYLPEGKTVGQNIIENVKKDLEKDCREGAFAYVR